MTRVSIANPVFATMLMVALAVLGLFSYQRLKVEQMPLFSGEFGTHNGRNAIKVNTVHAVREKPVFDPTNPDSLAVHAGITKS